MLRNGGDSQKMFSKEINLDFKKKKTSPQFGMIQFKREKEVTVLNLGKVIRTDMKTFDEKFKAFGMASLYSTKEIISGLDRVKK